MILVWFVIVPAVGGILAWLSGYVSPRWPKWVSLASLAITLVLVIAFWVGQATAVDFSRQGSFLAEIDVPWIPQLGLGIGFHLGMDGLSLLLVALAALMGVAAVLSAWTEIEARTGLFYLSLNAVLTGIIGVFMALDMFLFYFFWEMMLIPMYFIIALWGHENRVYASLKFLLYTQASGVLMLVSILALAFLHQQATGVLTFNYNLLLGTPVPDGIAPWLMLGFFAAFAVKLPAVPLHNWLPDAHTEAPTAGSVILAALLLKTGAYGLIRFVVPFFPNAAFDFSGVAMALGVIGIIYGAFMAFAQTDLKRLVAYTSVSHMGFVLLGVFAWNELALQGAVMQVLAHGVSTGALFIIVGALQERIHTRDMDRMGGLWTAAPKMGAVALVFSLGALGLPGLGNFVAEFLVLIGTYQVNIAAAVLGAIGIVVATVYALWIMQRAFHGPNVYDWRIPDLNAREMLTLGVLIVVLVWLGLYPQPVFDAAGQA